LQEGHPGVVKYVIYIDDWDIRIILQSYGESEHRRSRVSSDGSQRYELRQNVTVGQKGRRGAHVDRRIGVLFGASVKERQQARSIQQQISPLLAVRRAILASQVCINPLVIGSVWISTVHHASQSHQWGSHAHLLFPGEFRPGSGRIGQQDPRDLILRQHDSLQGPEDAPLKDSLD
jgi:hypothetical protein